MNNIKKKGFTLIELLTVIAIIGILASILIPTVAKVREMAAKTVCLSNLRQVMQATLVYAGDNDGFLPYSNWGPNVGIGWLYEAPLRYNQGAGQLDITDTGLLWPYIEDRTIYRCPTDWKEENSDLFQARAQRYSSYVMNGSVNGYAESMQGVPQATFRLEQFRGDSIIFWEADERIPFFYNDAANFPSEGISLRHGRGAHIAGIGGNVETISEDEYNEELNERPGRFWNVPGSPTGR